MHLEIFSREEMKKAYKILRKYFRLTTFLMVIALFLVNSCIDPFSIEIESDSSYLVVDGLLTNEEGPYEVRLSRSYSQQDYLQSSETGAIVRIETPAGLSVVLTEWKPGSYRTPGSSFRGEVGESYYLYIRTRSGEIFYSDTVRMDPVVKVDSVTYRLDVNYRNNGTIVEEGLRLYANTSGTGTGTQYYRWEYDECWKFAIPYPVTFEYINESTIPPVIVKNRFCWKYDKSTEVIVRSVNTDDPATVVEVPLIFIAPASTDRLYVQYSINVKQYSLSRKEYEFWSNLKQVNSAGGDLFDKQPFRVPGNIRNINDRSEIVLGYFQVSAVDSLRSYIHYRDIMLMGLPPYRTNCSLITVGRSDYESPRPTLDKIYADHISMGYVFVSYQEDDTGAILLNFANTFCSNCSLTGDPVPPLFWIDL